MQGVRCHADFPLVAESGVYSVFAVHELLTAAASLVAEHWFLGARASVVAARVLSSFSSWASSTGSVAVLWHVGLFLDQGLNLCLLH